MNDIGHSRAITPYLNPRADLSAHGGKASRPRPQVEENSTSLSVEGRKPPETGLTEKREARASRGQNSGNRRSAGPGYLLTYDNRGAGVMPLSRYMNSGSYVDFYI